MVNVTTSLTSQKSYRFSVNEIWDAKCWIFWGIDIFMTHVKKPTCEYKMQPAYHWACENMLGMDGMVLCGAIWPITGEKLGSNSNTDFCVFYVQFIIFSAPEVSRIAFWGCSKMSIFWRILAKMGDDQTLKADFSMKKMFFSNFLNVTRFVLSWKAQNRGLLR